MAYRSSSSHKQSGNWMSHIDNYNSRELSSPPCIHHASSLAFSFYSSSFFSPHFLSKCKLIPGHILYLMSKSNSRLMSSVTIIVIIIIIQRPACAHHLEKSLLNGLLLTEQPLLPFFLSSFHFSVHPGHRCCLISIPTWLCTYFCILSQTWGAN